MRSAVVNKSSKTCNSRYHTNLRKALLVELKYANSRRA
jgi:hypothetical protein